MSKLFAFLSHRKVVVGIYIITGMSIVGAVTSLNGLISTEHLMILVIVMLAAWGLPVIISVTTSRQYRDLFVNASEIANCYSDGEVPKSDLKYQMHNKHAEMFINSFNKLVSGAVLTRGMFSEVSLRLGLDAKNLSSTSAEISQMMGQQLDSTAHVQETIDSLQAAVNLASEVASNTYELASKSEREGASGKQVMTEAICGVMMLSESVNSAGKIIQNLGEDSKSIGGIIDVITGVAEQTNLLALNAAIEAARAGEQGRGFAVVADEVRTLASKTQESASKIHNIINLLLGHVDEAVTVINNSVEQADNADGLMEGVTVSYSEIVGLMVEVASHSNKLLDSSKQSENSANEAAESLNDIMESSQRSILKANILISESMELGKMGDQLSNMVSTKKDEVVVEEKSDSVELF